MLLSKLQELASFEHITDAFPNLNMDWRTKVSKKV